MRRTDREITDIEDMISIIDKCNICRLALAEGDMPYIIPMNYGYEYIEKKLTIYLHCAREGRKLDIIAKNPNACFEVDCSHRLIKGDEAHKYTMEYESVIVVGKISVCAERTEKIKGLKLLMQSFEKKREFSFSETVIDAVTVLKLEMTDITGKRNKK